jgi:lincosamide nucleotidyltransferase A/C/D/E
MDADHVVEIVDRLESNGIAAWLDGGWGIDALLGRQTRAHDDLDLIVRLEDVGRLEESLGALGYATAHGSPPKSFELTDAAGRQVDVHPVRFTASGDGLYRMDDDEEWIFPAGSLGGTGDIAGRRFRCMTPDYAIVSHTTGYDLDAAHRADVAALGERFGIPVPNYRSAD